MTLTPAGRDFLTAAALTDLVSTLVDVRIGMALAFVLTLSAGVSLLLLKRFRTSSLRAFPSSGQLTTFKGEGRAIHVTFGARFASWASVSAAPSLGENIFGVSVVSATSAGLELDVRPRYAGRFEGLKLQLELTDLFGLFAIRAIALDIPLVLDSLPTSLLETPEKVRLSPLALGERASGSPGSGQEFYGIDEYQPFMEAKNILWKRVGRRVDDRLVVKIREANIPRLVRIAVVIPNVKERPRYVDKTCEALGQICSSILRARSMVALTGFDRKGAVTAGASKPEELPQAIMETSALAGGQIDSEVISRSDLAILDSETFRLAQIGASPSGNAVLVVSDVGLPSLASRKVFVYTGHENLSRLVELLMNR